MSVIRRNLVDLPINYSLGYYWCRGFILSSFVVFQICTGIVLSFLYVADSVRRFWVVMRFSREDFCTWCLRYWHVWGVKVLFVLIFLHIGRSLYYSSYCKKGAWKVGFMLYFLLMAEAFTGYVLPWHQMSYWAATVLTSVIDSLPLFGTILYRYVVGGFSVRNVTLVRIFSVHIWLGFVMLGGMLLHMFYLHKSGSKNMLFSFSSFSDLVYFHSYHSSKDFARVTVVGLVTIFALLYTPNVLLDVERFIEADSLRTPVSIKPEWYFLFYYSILRCIESKLGGLMLIGAFLFFLWLPTFNEARVYSFCRQCVFWCIICLFISLTYLGVCHPEYPYIFICKRFRLIIVVFMFLFKLLWVVNGKEGRFI